MSYISQNVKNLYTFTRDSRFGADFLSRNTTRRIQTREDLSSTLMLEGEILDSMITLRMLSVRMVGTCISGSGANIFKHSFY